MANLEVFERMRLAKAFRLHEGYVLSFSNNTLQQFVGEVCNIDIYSEKYARLGTSKGKRFQVLLETESNDCVGKLIIALVEAYYANEWDKSEYTRVDDAAMSEVKQIGHRLLGKAQEKPKQNPVEQFLAREIGETPIGALPLTPEVASSIESRLDEIKHCLDSKAPLAVIFLCGSVLEGVLLGAASKDVIKFNQCVSSPKDSTTGKVKRLHEWSLSSFIDAAHEIGCLGLDVKKHCHALRDFRNYIHPNEQVVQKFQPDQHTAILSWQVLKAALSDVHTYYRVIPN